MLHGGESTVASTARSTHSSFMFCSIFVLSFALSACGGADPITGSLEGRALAIGEASGVTLIATPTSVPQPIALSAPPTATTPTATTPTATTPTATTPIATTPIATTPIATTPIATTPIATTPTATTPTATSLSTPFGVAVQQNQIRINNLSGPTVSNYPVQIGRPFRPGEIAAGTCPTFGLSGAPLQTQADVKNRWPDGSVKFAVLSTLVPSVAASSRAALSIGQGACALSGNADATRLLEPSRNFDVVLEFSGAVNATVSVRDMIAAGASRVWMSGPVTNSWVIGDHGTKRFDVGSDGHKSLRPVVHLQQWEGLDLYRIRVILEVSDTAKLQDQSYSVRISTGHMSRTVQYSSPTFVHTAGSRWTREFWMGSAKPVAKLGIDHGIGYLASTRAIPNYDSRIVMSPTAVASVVSQWISAPKGPFDAGMWTKFMPNTGGRPEIGLFPSWHIASLYSDDPQLQSAVAEQTDLAASWKMHYRTGMDRPFDDSTGSRGLGLPVTRDGFPTQFFFTGNTYLNGPAVAVVDRFNVLSPSANSGWVADGAHQPDPWYLMYLVSGDYWYLEQLQFWASWGLFISNPGTATWASGRGPRDTVIQEQLRGQAWILRTRARAAWASPDQSAEKTYFARATEQALRQMEGVRIGTGADPIRAWWAVNAPLQANPLRYWNGGGANMVQGISATDVATALSTWEYSMMLQSLGHISELGFGAKELLGWAGQSWISLATTAGIDPRHLSDYRLPVAKMTGGLFQTWEDVFDGYTSWSSAWESNLNDLQHGYSIFATAAMSFLRDQPKGDLAWDWVFENGYSKAQWSSNPKMAILPR